VSCRVRVAAEKSGAGKPVSLLLVGDSLTHGTLYPNELARLLSGPGNPAWKMLGSHRPDSAATGVAHEGYGGWTWEHFAHRYEAGSPATGIERNSPFVFPSPDGGAPVLDVARYFHEQCGDRRPDTVLFMLGINDCFSLNPEDPATLDGGIVWVLKQAETLLAAFRKAAPDAELGVYLTTPPNPAPPPSRRSTGVASRSGVGGASSTGWWNERPRSSAGGRKSASSWCPRS